MLDRDEKILISVGLMVIFVLLTSTTILLVKSRNQEKIIKMQPCKCEPEIEYINQTEYINWPVGSSIEVVGVDIIKLNCHEIYGSKVVVDFGYDRYIMRWSKFCDKLNENLRWLFLEDLRK